MGNTSSCCGSTAEDTGKTKAAEVVPASPGPALKSQESLPGTEEGAPAPDNPTALAVAKGGGGDGELTLLFGLPDGEKREVTFKHRPLGMTFYMLKPLKVKSVVPGSAAAEQGVAEGWQLLEVDGEDMVQDKAIEEIRRVVSSQSSRLPMGGG